MFERAVGIEAIHVHVPKHFLDLRALASANDVDEAKYLEGLGGRRMAVPAPHEDSVTMAASAAMGLFEHYDVSPEDIGMVIVGSESEVDGSKATAAWVHGMLHLPTRCRTFDVKHACYSGTAGLRLASTWCRAASPGGTNKALVIATDIARYEVGSPGEPTQGAGAVAMLVSDTPRLLALDPYPEALFTEDVMDFWRPTYRSSALVDGKTSIDSYLKALAHTFAEHERVSRLGFRDYDYLLFHVPFPKMAFKAFRMLYERDAIWRGDAPSLDADFERRTAPALEANRELGNLYSGSLYLSLAGLLNNRGARAESKRVGLFSYGSGCCAEFFSGRLGPQAGSWRGRIGIGSGISGRTELTYRQYLEIRKAGEALLNDSSYRLLDPGGDRRVSFMGIRRHQRIYEVSEVSKSRRKAVKA